MRYRIHLQTESSLDIEAVNEEEALKKAEKVPLGSRAWVTLAMPPTISRLPQLGDRVRVRLGDGSICRGTYQRAALATVTHGNEEPPNIVVTILEPSQEESHKPGEDEVLVECAEILLDSGEIVHDIDKHCELLEEGREPPLPQMSPPHHLEVPETPDDDIFHLVAYNQPKPS